MTNLHRLLAEQGQSPWLDNLSRDDLRTGRLGELITAGVRGVTANPTIIANAITKSTAYDAQFEELLELGLSVEQAFWELAVTDVKAALELFRPVYDASGGADGFASLELAPDVAYDAVASAHAARRLHEHITEPNLLVKIPATAAGVEAIRLATASGLSINVTLVFSLARYQQVIDAYISGLERFAAAGGDPSTVHSVASFFVSRVDTEVDRRLAVIGSREAAAVKGLAAIAQAKVAYATFHDTFHGPRWDRLAAQGARRQRPLWASTSTKDPSRPDTLYVDTLIGTDTVTTLPEKTIDAFNDHGTVRRTIDIGLGEARAVLRRLERLGIDLADVGETLEDNGIAAFARSLEEAVDYLAARPTALAS